jgi:hypothetical protein
MAQAETLQDIYSKIADIYDKFCNLDEPTYLKTNISLSDQDFSVTQLTLDNPNNSAAITDAESKLNQLIQSTVSVAKENRLATDAVYQATNGDLVPIPKGSPLELLPILLKAILLYRAPLKVLLNIIASIIEDVLKEFLRRKITEKNAVIGNYIGFSGSTILQIPDKASHVIVQSRGFPSYISKRFDNDIDKSLIKKAGQANPDLSKYIGSGLSTLSFGFALSGQISQKNVFWNNDIKIEYADQIIEIPKFPYMNIDKYAYFYLNEQMNVGVSYLSEG